MTEPLDPWGMAWVHQVYRRELRLLVDLIAAVEPGDRARAAVVAEHLTDMAASLHEHHVGEDELLWPPLLSRAEPDAAAVLRMQQQHDELHALLEEAGALAPVWRESASRADRDRLAAVAARLSVVTDAHLADEEQHVLPLIREHITAEEWAEFERRGHASIPPEKALVFLGIGLQDATPHEREKFVGGLPPEVRDFWAGPGGLQYAQWRAELLGGAPAAAP
ncbi:hemerythrin domain-containing protein [Dactylosporangium salmoneum]|uniref:Hemerythrin-like domain-containing protein n=1 Tax=Dactylosporangium salmoneum TaxID=53361 RepID=A0ABP5TN27_9ACTN